MRKDENGLNWFNRNWRIITTIGTILVTIGILYARVDNNSTKADSAATKAEINEKAIIGIQKDIDYVKQDTSDIKIEQKVANKRMDDMMAIQQKILEEVKK